MATELKTQNKNYCLTRFYGGDERGVSVQVNSSEAFGQVRLTRTEAAQLAEDLLRFANGNEEEQY